MDRTPATDVVIDYVEDLLTRVKAAINSPNGFTETEMRYITTGCYKALWNRDDRLHFSGQTELEQTEGEK